MKCEIIKDLLPVYAEGICSDEAAREIEEHIKTCTACSESLNACRSEMTAPMHPSGSPEKPFKRILHCVRRSIITITLLIIVILAILSVLALLTFGQVRKADNNPYLPSFDTCISSIKAKHTVKKFMSGDIEYLMDNIDLNLPNVIGSETEEFRNRFKEEYRTLFSEIYEKFYEGKSITITAEPSVYIYNDHFSRSREKGYIQNSFTVSTGSLPDLYIELNEYEGVMYLEIYITDRAGNEELSLLTDRVMQKLNFRLPDIYDLFFDMDILSDLNTQEDGYTFDGRYFGSSLSDGNTDYEREAAKRFIELKDSQLRTDIEDCTIGQYRYSFDKDIIYTDLTLFFTDLTTGKRAVYTRTVVTGSSSRYVFFPEEAPEIIDEGISPQYRKMLEELF